VEHLLTTHNSPVNPTRQKIIDAALLCIEKWGVEKISINDIAKQAGVTRPTVYNHFPNKDEIIQAALLQAGLSFGEKLFKHFNKFEKPAERLLEAMMYSYQHLPKETYLGIAVGGEMARQVNERALSSKESHEIRLLLFGEILKHDQQYQSDMEEISEVSTRFLLSLLTVEGIKKRTQKEVKEFLSRRLLPALGMSL